MSRTRIIVLLTAVLAAGLGLGAIACSRSDAALPAPPAGPAPALATPGNAAGLPRLVFFMNPNGRPCQLQEQVLQQVAAELQGRAEVVRLRTTTPEDLPMFERFGVRSLPQLVVTDATGRELRRATPGIQDADQLRRLLAP